MEDICSLINCLTSDEDQQQELWVHYLSGNAAQTFESRLEEIKSEYSEELRLRTAIWQLINNPPSDKLMSIMHNFTDFERSIICLLMLGLCVEKISAIKGINEVRIRQSIASIRYNEAWSIYGLKDKTIR